MKPGRKADALGRASQPRSLGHASAQAHRGVHLQEPATKTGLGSVKPGREFVAAAAAPLGMPMGKAEHHPGWKPLQGSAATMSQAGLQARAGLPAPRRQRVLRYVRTVPTTTPSVRTVSKPCAPRGCMHGGVTRTRRRIWLPYAISWAILLFSLIRRFRFMRRSPGGSEGVEASETKMQ